MPVRNVVRVQAPNTYYHVYNRGHNKGLLFIEDSDYMFFEFLLQRCFGPQQLKNREGKRFPWFGDRISLNAYCLMPNHFHLLLYQGDDKTAISKSMQSLLTTYAIYFNAKYSRRGTAFESAFKASPIFSSSYLMHITRYIHLNPEDFKTWRYSSYQDYRDRPRLWVDAEKILEIFTSRQDYLSFINNYSELHKELAKLKHQLADNAED